MKTTTDMIAASLSEIRAEREYAAQRLIRERINNILTLQQQLLSIQQRLAEARKELASTTISDNTDLESIT